MFLNDQICSPSTHLESFLELWPDALAESNAKHEPQPVFGLICIRGISCSTQRFFIHHVKHKSFLSLTQHEPAHLPDVLRDGGAVRGAVGHEVPGRELAPHDVGVAVHDGGAHGHPVGRGVVQREGGVENVVRSGRKQLKCVRVNP